MRAVKMLFAAISGYGHVYPLMPLALACAEAGHEVTIATAPPFLGRLPLPTISQQPTGLDVSDAFAETMRRDPKLTGMDVAMRMFADVACEAVCDTLLPALEQDRPDLVVYEAMNVGAGVVADLLQIPAVAYAISLTHMGYAIIHPDAKKYRAQLWHDRGRNPPEDSPVLARALLSPCPPSLLPAAGPLDVAKIPIRPVPYAESLGSVPAWLAEPPTRPRVYLTLGTVSFGAVEVLQRAIADTASLDVDLLVTVGPDGDPAALGDVPDNVHLERFVDQAAVLPLVDLVVHHGGTGTVLSAMSAGLPQLLLPQGADQFFNATSLTEAGVVRALLNEQQAPGSITAAVEALLGDCPEREAAHRLRAEIAEMPAPAEVVDQLVELATTGPEPGRNGGGGGI